MVRVGVVGLGLIGRQRLAALVSLKARGEPVEVVGVVDPTLEGDPAPAGDVPIAAGIDELAGMSPDWVVVATPHDVALDVARSLLAAGVAVLIEKPMGRDAGEALALMAAVQRPGQLRVGLNYRFFGGVEALLADARAGHFGELISLDIVLGHGGSPGDERSWKLDPVRAGGGCLIDPGIHVLDLLLQIAGPEVEVVGARTWSGFWNTGIEEEAHLLLAGPILPIANVQLSVVRWKSTFRMELHGTEGYGVVEGRGRSYGVQSYRRGKRWGWRGASTQSESEELLCQTDGDSVFERELAALLCGPAGTSTSVGTADEALAAIRLVEACRTAAGIAAVRPAEVMM